MKVNKNRLLMMFIIDGYKSSTGKISKKTAIEMMKYVGQDKELQRLINNSDYSGVLKHQLEA
jgi:hypothetical protein